MIRARAVLVALALGACAAPTRTLVTGQVVLHFDTDAPIPAAPGQVASLATPLFDRLRVEIFPPGATAPCAGCTNEFEINVSLFTQLHASIGVAPPVGASGYRVRARMYKTRFAGLSGEPDADSTVDVTAALPVVSAGAVVHASVMLATDRVGQPLGSLGAPVDATPGAPTASLVGTWPGADRVDCPRAPPAGAVCVPGGAFWMGNPRAPGFNPRTYVSEPRLVVLAPFFLSATEVTVRDFRASGKTPKEAWSGSRTGVTAQDWCTFTASPGPFDRDPVTCVDAQDARDYCASIGAELPSEAEFEYAEGALAGSLFPWGEDEPGCADAVFGRSGFGIFAGALAPCKDATLPPGSPEVPGSGARDHVDLPTGSIFDLAGNVSEWTRDQWNRIDEPCWARPGVYRDPVCTTPSAKDGPLGVYRGGNWAEVPDVMLACGRSSAALDVDDPELGFRCAWPAK